MVVNSLNPTSLSRPEDIKRKPFTDGQTVLAHWHKDSTNLVFLPFVLFKLSINCKNIFNIIVFTAWS